MTDPRSTRRELNSASTRPASTLGAASTRQNPSPEPYDSLARRNAAAEILGSYEKLSWWSQQRCESLTQTRQHFLGIIAYLTPDEGPTYWKVDNTPHPPASPGQDTGPVRVSRAGQRAVDKTSDKDQLEQEGMTALGIGSSGKKRKSTAGRSEG